MTRARSVFLLAGLVAAVPLAVALARADGRSRAAQSAKLRGRLASTRAVEESSARAAMFDGRVEVGACPEEMTLVEGDWCPRVEQHCLHWMDPPGRYHEYRCAEYARPARCLAPRMHQRFCIDRHERAEPSSGLPLNAQSWSDAKDACEADGARVCLDSEWTFACEGEEMRPYPYGWHRAANKCNADKKDLLVAGEPWHLRDERAPTGAHPECASPFGLLDMAGNVAEWVSVDGYPEGSVVVQKGNWWQPGKHACRDAQAGHDRYYKGTETGFRCCAAARL
jgi:hypothetical protein